ncbi:hypothetical protein [Pseudomonas putida]|uniref:hypothetical protein n=1 Tax=Pseudomonas putida TaxID=303 RepID=UPI0023632C1E|nr:hypothetical protein [Pseudomonas putida]MDD2005658.1 hypothetical protein [Pseudomonas putida]
MDRRLSAALACLAFALASVTAISVAMTIFSLLDDPLLAVLFSGAAVLLDIFKYIGWPLAARLNQVRRRFSAIAICSCVVALGLVSGWSTYDRLMTSIEASKVRQSALKNDRLAHLASLIKKDSDFLETLGTAEKKLESESADLRARGMATKAQELESATFDRIDKQRLAAMARLETNSTEIVDIRSSVTKAASLPIVFVAFLCAGFAFALELVPALLLTILRNQHVGTYQAASPVDFAHEVPEVLGCPKEHQPPDLTKTSCNPLLDALLHKISSLPPNSKIKVKDFAIENKIGNLKSCAAFKAAEEIGAIQKTPHGYLTTVQL